MSKSYKIATIQDMLAVPADRRAAMLSELELAFDLLEFAMADLRTGELLHSFGQTTAKTASLWPAPMGKTFSGWR